jgi:hypothetical protein
LPSLAGPGVVIPSTEITFNKVGDIFGNGPLGANTNQFLSEFTQTSFPLLAWASFDGSTNDPIVYPNGNSVQNLQNQLIIYVSPVSLPDGTNNLAYTPTTFTATGGHSPYVWSLASGSQLPLGVALSSDGSGVLSGTPSGNTAGTYDFTIQLTDADNRVLDLNYSITLH